MVTYGILEKNVGGWSFFNKIHEEKMMIDVQYL